MFGKNKIKKRLVYLDHAAATGVDAEVLEAMLPYFSGNFANPSSIYSKGRETNGVLNDARRSIARIFNALPENILFTSGGTESDNLAVFGVAEMNKKNGRHIISTEIEHHAILYPIKELAKRGFVCTFIKTDKTGIIKTSDVIAAIRPDTTLVSIMYANNEIGVIEPIAEIGRAILQYRKKHHTPFPYFHTDACQAAGYLDLDVEKLHVDLMTVSGSKIYGPKGVGVLYVRRGVKIKSMILGGFQERHLRAGTENLAGAVGLDKALQIAQKNSGKECARQRELAGYLWKNLQANIPNIYLNGPMIGNKRLPNNINIIFMGAEGEALLLYLDAKGIMCSTGSACTAGSLLPSHVLTAIGLSAQSARASLRFSLGKKETKRNIDYVIHELPPIVTRSREINRQQS